MWHFKEKFKNLAWQFYHRFKEIVEQSAITTLKQKYNFGRPIHYLKQTQVSRHFITNSQANSVAWNQFSGKQVFHPSFPYTRVNKEKLKPKQWTKKNEAQFITLHCYCFYVSLVLVQ